ncbi:hypothetical protein ACIA8K_15595 [Catenuloplanes sp. NPDC051500]|uniref:hypothetical protein n=1 Tax=Catenuloplanes sp. NPDC051500 TaxID=3363959 RepID=UPI0037A56734
MFVVTSGAPESLKLVTAGTNVCSPRVRGAAPAAVRAVACDEASLPTAAPTTPAFPGGTPTLPGGTPTLPEGTPSNRLEI